MSNDNEIGPPRYISITDDDGKLIFKFDPERDIIWVRRRGEDVFVDLRQKKEEWRNTNLR